MKLMLKLRAYHFLPLFMLLMSACEIINPTEEIPAYLKVDTVTVSTTYNTQGSASHKITDCWVYVDDNLVGTYEMPATFPVLGIGNRKITVKAGVKMNGIGATRIPYPFYSDYIVNTTLHADCTLTLMPAVQYHSTTNFAWREDFEDAGISLRASGESQTTVQRVSNSPEVMEGNSSAMFTLSESQTHFECMTVDSFSIPPVGKILFLELNYKNNMPFAVGIQTSTAMAVTKDLTIFINPSENWNKIYINLTEQFGLTYTPGSFKIFFAMAKASGGAAGRVLVDNIKLVR